MEEQVNGSPKRKIWKILLLILLALVGIAATVWFVAFRVNVFSLNIVLNGDRDMIIEYGETYQEPGGQVYLQGTLFLQEGILLEEAPLQISGEVQEDLLGIYPVTYEAEYGLWKASMERSILVMDTKCPVIELVPGPEETILPGTVYEEPGFKATDNYDGDITDRVIRREEMGVITYAVVDSSGNPGYASREVPYHDPEPPQLSLIGDEHMTITVGTRFTEPGYSAEDNVDGNMTELVRVEGEVDWLNPGIYPITYRVTDAYQNETAQQRTVEVVAKPWPEIQWPTQKTIYLTFDDGPGPYTTALLDVLDKYGVKATFFVVNSGYYNTMRQIVNRGHSIGIHSVTHTYEEIYASPEAFFADLHQMQDIIYQQTGVRTNLMRFPGGSSNLISKETCEGLMTILSDAVQNAGFRYFDWNVDSNDAGGARKKETVRDNVICGASQQRVSIVLQHDIHAYSVDAVEEIIQWGLSNGYRFAPLKENSPGMHHGVLN